MVNKYWLAQVQSEQQKEMLAKLNSGECIVKDGRIILNESFLKKQARIKHQIQQLELKWQKEQAKRAEQAWQRRLTHLEKCLVELAKGGKDI